MGGDAVTLTAVIDECEAAWARFMALAGQAPRELVDEPGVCGEWSLKTLVGHVGYWDGVEAEYFAAGNRPELHWQALNDANVTANAGRAFEELCAEARSNHDAMVHVMRRRPEIDPVSARELTVDHYVEHADQIAAWLQASAPTGDGDPHEALGYGPATPVDELLARIESSWSAFGEIVRSAPEERFTEPGVCGDWSIKDLMGHVAFWDQQVVDDIDGYVALRPPLKNPWNDWNATEAAKRADRTVEQQAAEMAAAHQRMLDALAHVESIDGEMIGVDTWQHYDEHRAEIARWLATQPTR